MPEWRVTRGVTVDKVCRGAHDSALTRAGERLAPGDKVLVIPSHGCTTFNLHDWVYGVRGGRLECGWPIAARGRFT